jgi:hypothetical protein
MIWTIFDLFRGIDIGKVYGQNMRITFKRDSKEGAILERLGKRLVGQKLGVLRADSETEPIVIRLIPKEEPRPLPIQIRKATAKATAKPQIRCSRQLRIQRIILLGKILHIPRTLNPITFDNRKKITGLELEACQTYF